MKYRRVLALAPGVAVAALLLLPAMAGADSAGVGVSANVGATLSFAVTPGTAPSGGNVTASAIDFGSMVPEVAKMGSHRLTISANTPSGYNVTAAEDHPLTSGAYTIPDVLGDTGAITEAVAGAWANAATHGFGYTLTNVSGTSAVFTGGYKQFANAAAAETPQVIMLKNAPASGDSADVGYKLNASAAQAAGAYSNVITYVATGNF